MKTIQYSEETKKFFASERSPIPYKHLLDLFKKYNMQIQVFNEWGTDITRWACLHALLHASSKSTLFDVIELIIDDDTLEELLFSGNAEDWILRRKLK